MGVADTAPRCRPPIPDQRASGSGQTWASSSTKEKDSVVSWQLRSSPLVGLKGRGRRGRPAATPPTPAVTPSVGGQSDAARGPPPRRRRGRVDGGHPRRDPPSAPAAVTAVVAATPRLERGARPQPSPTAAPLGFSPRHPAHRCVVGLGDTAAALRSGCTPPGVSPAEHPQAPSAHTQRMDTEGDTAGVGLGGADGAGAAAQRGEWSRGPAPKPASGAGARATARVRGKGGAIPTPDAPAGKEPLHHPCARRRAPPDTLPRGTRHPHPTGGGGASPAGTPHGRSKGDPRAAPPRAQTAGATAPRGGHPQARRPCAAAARATAAPATGRRRWRRLGLGAGRRPWPRVDRRGGRERGDGAPPPALPPRVSARRRVR